MDKKTEKLLAFSVLGAIGAFCLHKFYKNSKELSTDTEITIAYWTIRGLGAPLRMMVLYSGCKLKNIMYDCAPVESGSTLSYDRSAWFNVKPSLKEKNPLVNLPYCVIGDEIISQTNAIFVYLGEKLGMLGDDQTQRIQCEALLSELMDLRNLTTGHAYGRSGQSTDEHFSNICGPSGIFQKLELCLKQNQSKYGGSGTFLVGNKASAPDFHLWEMLTQAVCLAERDNKENPLTNFPALQHFYKNFTELPNNQRYLKSNLVDLPFNNKPAPFGGAQDMYAWQQGTKYDFDKWSGKVY